MNGSGSGFVGRVRELERLDGLLREALEGRGRVAFVAGEPGAGKTTLLSAFAERAEAAHPDLLYAYADCDARTGAGDAYLPFREILALLAGETHADVAQGNITEETASRLKRFLNASGEVAFEAGTEVLGVFLPGAGLLAKLATRIARRGRPASVSLAPAEIQDQYTRIVQAAAASHPLVLVVDDLQWADAASLDLFFHLARRLEGSPSVLVGTYRPNDVAMGRAGGRHPLEPVLSELRRYGGDIVIDLDAADDSARREFVVQLLGTRPHRFDDEFVERLYEHTGGHALFVVEVLSSLEQRGEIAADDTGESVAANRIDWSRIPAKIEGVIAERMGRLDADVRADLEVASVDGEEFAAEVVAGVRGIAPRDMIRRLSAEADRRHRLVGAQGIRSVATTRLSSYRFRHALFQRYLYGSLDAVERPHLHQDVGEALERLLGDARDEIAVRLAAHFVEAGDTDRSVRYLLAAGRGAMRLSAHSEAIGHYRRGIEIVEAMPSGPERDRYELALRAAMGTPLVALRGYADDEVERLFERAHRLATSVGDDEDLPTVLFGLMTFNLARGRPLAARVLAERRVDLARRSGNGDVLREALVSLGYIRFYLGDVGPAIDLLIAAEAIEPGSAGAVAGVFDPEVSIPRGLGLLYWLRGDSDRAAAASADAIRVTRASESRYALSSALAFGAVLAAWQDRANRAARLAEECHDISQTDGYGFWIPFSSLLRDWARGRLAVEVGDSGEVEQRIAAMEAVLDRLAHAGTELWLPYFLSNLADLLVRAGRDDRARDALSRALESSARTGVAFWDAELLRRRAALLAEGEPAAARDLLERAIATAREQDAVTLEQWAAADLEALS